MITCNNDGLMLILDRNLFIYGVFRIFITFLRFSLILMNMQMRCFTYRIISNGLCLSSNSVPSLVFYDKYEGCPKSS